MHRRQAGLTVGIYRVSKQAGAFRVHSTIRTCYYGNLENHQNGICMDTGIRRFNENLFKNLRTLANIRINLISPEILVHPEHFAADSMGLPLLVLTQLFSKYPRKNSRRTCVKHNLMAIQGHSRSCFATTKSSGLLPISTTPIHLCLQCLGLFIIIIILLRKKQHINMKEKAKYTHIKTYE